jgi:hypothetical protein
VRHPCRLRQVGFLGRVESPQVGGFDRYQVVMKIGFRLEDRED